MPGLSSAVRMVWESKLHLYVQVVRSYIFSSTNICHCKRYLTFFGGAQLLPLPCSKPLQVWRGVVTGALPAFHGAPLKLRWQTVFFRLLRSFCRLHLHRQDPAKITEPRPEPFRTGRTECVTRNSSYRDPEWNSAYLPSSGRTCMYICSSICICALTYSTYIICFRLRLNTLEL